MPFYKTIFDVRLCWELEEPKGLKGPFSLLVHLLAILRHMWLSILDIHNPKCNIVFLILTFSQFESDEMKRKTHSFSFELDLRP